ncbi:ectonucleoside triphosphate diphosphohydrolase 6 [Phyllostomus discolor]|uniref:Ectonucleoside triphosphate diphosphohydrolase 6 n=1 Tax=Phyllostomus discolor TaxID=89673 RepID=A0A833ZAD1_9CHIR|nr:ectonucleoside triphosphate diphosphohydrolase 6 [Phyllostomus discolor]
MTDNYGTKAKGDRQLRDSIIGVKEVFKASPFLVGDDCVSVMNGTDEGISAWITINFLTAVNLHQLCAHRVLQVLKNKVHSTEEVNDMEFYAFSYYYDLATNVGLIVCQTVVTQPQSNPFMCMDLTYVSLLLQEFGFLRNEVLKLTQKINNVETNWALGAIFHYIDSLNGQKSRAL